MCKYNVFLMRICYLLHFYGDFVYLCENNGNMLIFGITIKYGSTDNSVWKIRNGRS